VRLTTDTVFETTDEVVGEIVTDIQKIDPDWWLVKNEAGQVRISTIEKMFAS
jgi:hypothetical protein